MRNNYRELISFFSANKSKFPNYVYGAVLKTMENLEKDVVTILTANCRFKNPIIIFIISIFVGYLGIDRFLLRHNFRGIIKLFYTLCIPIYFIMTLVAKVEIPKYVLWSILSVVGILWIIDIFVIISDTRKNNWALLECNLLSYFNFFEKSYDTSNLDDASNKYYSEMALFSKIHKKIDDSIGEKNFSKGNDTLKAEYEAKISELKQFYETNLSEYDEQIKALRNENDTLNEKLKQLNAESADKSEIQDKIREIVTKMREKGMSEDEINQIIGNNFDVI